ncbi:hypothetical protein K4K51_004879 [Colletotrichum sp. SAR 10_75]|nr:hypothetical protein K4K51_004879 [Colletotrichum sp. SAR 10_75]
MLSSSAVSMPSKLITHVLFTDEYLPHSRRSVHNAPYAEIFHIETDVKMDDESTRHAAFKQNPNHPAVFNALKGTESGTSDTLLTSTAREAGHTRATHLAGKLEGRSIRFAMMAVLNELPGIRITIEVNHVKAQKYSDEDGPAEDKNNRRATNRCSKYIESKDDSRYRK